MPPPSSAVFFASAPLPPLFSLLGISLAAVVLMSLLLLRFRQSLLAAYFLCGVVVANCGLLETLGGAQSSEKIGYLAQIGVVLLMFTLGLEFSLKELRHLRRYAFRGGAWQMFWCIVAGCGAALACGLPAAQAAVIGILLAASSTAVSLKIIQDMNLGASPGARFALGVAIFQDLFIIASSLALPLILTASGGGSSGAEGAGKSSFLGSVVLVSVQSAVFLALAVLMARFLFPRLLHAVADTRSSELFTLTVVGLCAGLALLGGVMGLGLALGAFVAGLAVSESIFKHRILSDVLPLKHLFLTLFFLSAGLAVDLNSAVSSLPAILTITVALLVGKLALVAAIGRRMGLPLQDAFFAAASLSSAGEFSLVLLQQAEALRPWPPRIAEVLSTSIALSMGLAPLLVKFVPVLTRWGKRMGWQKPPPAIPSSTSSIVRTKLIEDHAIVCGFGPVGQRLVESLKRAGVPALVVELNAQTVRTLHKQGQPVLFADAGHHETWELAKVRSARFAAFTFSDAAAAGRALAVLRQVHPELPVIARTRFVSDIERLQHLGATLVIQDETEAAKAFERETLSLCSAAFGATGKS
jgi:CPA2 family monovalent cation:H+ antiporter-2